MKPPPLQFGDYGRQRVCRAANADVQQNNCAVELCIAFTGDPIDQELGSLRWFDSVLTIERPVD